MFHFQTRRSIVHSAGSISSIFPAKLLMAGTVTASSSAANTYPIAVNAPGVHKYWTSTGPGPHWLLLVFDNPVWAAGVYAILRSSVANPFHLQVQAGEGQWRTIHTYQPSRAARNGAFIVYSSGLNEASAHDQYRILSTSPLSIAYLRLLGDDAVYTEPDDDEPPREVVIG